jgi:hypothetical protein
MIFCIPKNLVKKLKESAIKGEINIKDLYKMTSAERRAFFTKYTDENLGKLLNTEFEKAMVSKQQTAMTDWAKSVFSPKEKAKPAYKSILDKINKLDEEGILNPSNTDAFLEDLVADKLGVSVTPEEIKVISEKATKIQEAQTALGNDLGNPAKSQENIDFFTAKKDMDDYLQALNPAHNLKVLTGTIGRGMMLASVKSPILNIGSNIEVGTTEAISRRLAGNTWKGTDNKLATDYIKMVNKIYTKSGYDISRMVTINDQGVSGGRILGETVHAQGPGAIRKAGQWVEDIVFKNLMGAPDVAFSSAHFADSVNLKSLQIAKGDAVKAKEMMIDAMRIQPQTPEGEILRSQGILDAQTATWTNKTWASTLSEGIRKVINSVSGDARAGDWLMPFVKTPANVIATGIDYAGGGGVKALYKTVQAIRSGNLGTKEYWNNITRDLVRAGLGLVGAVVIAYNLDDDDFVGAYDPARAQIEQLRGSNYNAIRIGNKWVSTDWLGPLSVPVSSIMYARKYGDTKPETIFQYTKGTVSAIKQLPGISDIFDFARTSSYQKNTTLEEMTGETAAYILEQVYSRLVPSVFSDIAKATDTKERETSGSTVKIIESKIPGLRQTLQEKTDIFGETIKTEPAWSVIAFGSRVKTNKENALIAEINQVTQDTGKSVTFTNWDKSSSKTLAQFKKEVGEEDYKTAKLEYGERLKERLEDIVSDNRYEDMTPEDKLRNINNADSAIMTEIFKDYGFKYRPEEKASKLLKF